MLEDLRKKENILQKNAQCVMVETKRDVFGELRIKVARGCIHLFNAPFKIARSPADSYWTRSEDARLMYAKTSFRVRRRLDEFGFAQILQNVICIPLATRHHMICPLSMKGQTQPRKIPSKVTFPLVHPHQCTLEVSTGSHKYSCLAASPGYCPHP